MRVNRRFVLKSIAVSSIAGLTIGRPVCTFAAAAATAAVPRVLALANDGAAQSIFLYGAMTARALRLEVQKVGGDLGFMLDFERQLRKGQPLRVIGLLDDASAVLLIDIARGAGARLHWLGQHRAEAGFSRHRLLNTELAAGRAQQFSRQLHECGADFSVHEECRNEAMSACGLAGSPHNAGPSAQWASSIGYLLASPGTWGTTPTAPLAPATSTPIIGSFVSFSIEA